MSSPIWRHTMAAALTLVFITAADAQAQQFPGQQPYPNPSGTPPAKAPSRPPATAPASSGAPVAKPVAKEPGTAEASRGTDSGLRQRVEQIEEQLVDMRVVMDTLESLARSPGGGAPAGAAGRPAGPAAAAFNPGEAGRVDGLETQIRALTAQLEQLTEQVRALEARRAGAPVATGSTLAVGPAASDSRPGVSAPIGFGAPVGTGMADTRPPEAGTRIAGFGSTSVTAGPDPIGQILSDNRDAPPGRAAAPPPAPVPAPQGATPKQQYETAYGYMLQQNYAAAESAFEEFLAQHPNDPLAGNAQYWLAETYFVRGQFKQSAGAFLKGYKTYGNSAKAPDSLLKLAMSLGRLGQKDAACSSYAELETRFPTAPQSIKTRAQAERQRAGC